MRRSFILPLVCLAATAAWPAHAQPRLGGNAAEGSATAPQTDDQRKAQEHFQRAKELYQGGKYSEAITELEVARRLDPHAKDLVMNLGIVHEKLGAYDEAITDLKSFLEMDGVTAAERGKVEGMIKRIEGAKASAPAQPSTAPQPAPPTTEPQPEPRPAAPPKGRIDGLTIGAGAVTAVGLIVGTSLGIYAVSTRPESGFVTGRDGTYATFQDKTNAAHSAAIVADVSFVVSAIAAVATAWLYFGRPKASSISSRLSEGRTRLSISPTFGSTTGTLLGGTF